MAAGDFIIRRNSADTNSVPNAGGGNLDSLWDAPVVDQGGTITYSAGTFTLDTGIYLFMYSEYFSTTDTTNNERIEIQGEIHESGVGAIGGYGQDYIRKSSGQQECVVSSAMILEVSSDNTDYFIRFYRTDNSTTGTVDRVPDFGGVIILELDNNDNFGLYSTSASEATSGTAVRTLNINTNDRQDTGFSRSGDIVTVSNAGRYLMCYNLDVSETATGREDVRAMLERNSTTPVVGSYASCYLRGSDGTQDGALCWMGIVDVSASDTFRVRWDCPTSATITAAAGATLQMWQIPSSGDTVIVEATNGDMNANNVDFVWDTLPHIDTASFTATAGNSNIDVDQADYVLTFTNLHNEVVATPQRAYPLNRIKVNEVIQNYAAAGAYHRNNSGVGRIACNVCGIFEIGAPNLSVELNTRSEATTGTVAQSSGQFAMLSLETLYGPYSFPPTITDFNTTEQFNWGNTGLVISGNNFEDTQGTGKVEFWDDTLGTTKTVQTVSSWTGTSITINTVRGSLPDDSTVYLVVTTDGGLESTPFAVSVGLESYESIVAGLNPDHYWTFNNTYNDIGDNGPNNCSVTAGSPGFTTNPLTRGRSHSFTISAQGQRIEPPNSNWMNAQTEQTRSMGGWIRFNQVQNSFVCFYEEGGGVNNLAFFMGIGGILIAQLADTGDDNVHAYSNFKLEPNRDYHILFRFDYVTRDLFELLVDGVLQEVTFGNPLISAGNHLDAHSGDIGWGDAAGNLEVFGTDITFPAPEISYYNDWASWTTLLTSATTRSELFEKGVIQEITITGDTIEGMQSQIDAYSGTSRPNYSCTFVLEETTSTGSTKQLFFRDIVFDEGTSIHVQYRGSSTIDLINQGTSNLDSTKFSTIVGGTLNLGTAVPVKITTLDINTKAPVEGSRVLLEAATGGTLSAGTEIIQGVTDSNGEIETTLVYSSDQPVSGKVRRGTNSPYYQQATIINTITSTGLDATILLIPDE